MREEEQGGFQKDWGKKKKTYYDCTKMNKTEKSSITAKVNCFN